MSSHYGSSRTAYFGLSIAICKISLRFFCRRKACTAEREVKSDPCREIHLLIELRK